MGKGKTGSFKERIVVEMTVDYSSALEKNFDLAKQFIRITREGKVDVRCKDSVVGKQQILLYLIGKMYSKEAGFSSTDDVDNKELLNELGLPGGSLRPWLKNLREKKRIRQVKRAKSTYHAIRINVLEKTLKEVEKRLKKSS